MDHDQASNFGDNDVEKPVVEIDIKNACDASEYACLESYLQKLPGTVSVNLDRTRGVAHISYNPAVTTHEKLRAALQRCGYECDCYVRVGSKAQAGHPQGGTPDQAVHAAHTAVGGREAAPHRDHAAMDHGGHEGHGAEMVRDFLRRLVVSTILSLPLIIFSPVGAMFGLPSMPPFGLSIGLLGFLLATPVVWWGGWPFISAAWRALRAGEVNMMTLIALGILVSYIYSVAATFLFSSGYCQVNGERCHLEPVDILNSAILYRQVATFG